MFEQQPQPTPKRDRKTFAAAVRAAYPGAYDAVDDDSLVDAYVQAYPDYLAEVDTREEASARERGERARLAKKAGFSGPLPPTTAELAESGGYTTSKANEMALALDPSGGRAYRSPTGLSMRPVAAQDAAVAGDPSVLSPRPTPLPPVPPKPDLQNPIENTIRDPLAIAEGIISGASGGMFANESTLGLGDPPLTGALRTASTIGGAMIPFAAFGPAGAGVQAAASTIGRGVQREEQLAQLEERAPDFSGNVMTPERVIGAMAHGLTTGAAFRLPAAVGRSLPAKLATGEAIGVGTATVPVAIEQAMETRTIDPTAEGWDDIYKQALAIGAGAGAAPAAVAAVQRAAQAGAARAARPAGPTRMDGSARPTPPPRDPRTPRATDTFDEAAGWQPADADVSINGRRVMKWRLMHTADSRTPPRFEAIFVDAPADVWSSSQPFDLTAANGRTVRVDPRSRWKPETVGETEGVPPDSPTPAMGPLRQLPAAAGTAPPVKLRGRGYGPGKAYDILDADGKPLATIERGADKSSWTVEGQTYRTPGEALKGWKAGFGQAQAGQPSASVPPPVELMAGRKVTMKMPDDPTTLTKILGSSLYKGSRASTIVKELLQNATDEVFLAKANDRTIDLEIVSPHPWAPEEANLPYHITVRDRGRGLLPDQVEDVLLTLSGSGKRGDVDASGGFGLAKAGFIAAADEVDMTTVAVDPQGQKIRTTLKGPPSSMEISSEVVPADTPTGLSFTSKLIRREGESMETYGISNIVEYVTRGNKIPGGRIGLSHLSYDDLKQTKRRLPQYYDFTDTGSWTVVAERDIPEAGGLVRVLAKPDAVKVKQKNTKGFVLNRGLGTSISVGAGAWNGPDLNLYDPKDLRIDVLANVEEGAPTYPFTANREDLRGSARDAVASLFEETVYQPALADYTTARKGLLTGSPEITRGRHFGPVRLLDPGGRLRPEEIETFRTPQIQKMSLVFEDVIAKLFKRMEAVTPGRFGGHRIRGTGLIVGDSADAEGSTITYGVYVPEGPDAGGIDQDYIFLNPFSAVAKSLDNLKRLEEAGNILEPGTNVTDMAAAHLYHTIIHEVIHNPVKGHDTEFAYTLADVYGAIDPTTQRKQLNAIKYALSDAKGSVLHPEVAKALRVYLEARGRADTRPNLLSGEFLGGEGQRAGEGAVPPSAPAGDAGVGVQGPDAAGKPVDWTDLGIGAAISGATYAATGDEEAAMAAAVPIPGLYSRLRKGMRGYFERTGAKQVKANSLLAQVRNFGSAEEIKWTGLEDFLRSRAGRPVTAQEVDDYLAAHDIKVEEVRLGGGGERPTVYGPDQDYRTWSIGNENYREILLTLPSHYGLFKAHNWADAPMEARDGAAVLGHIRTSDLKVGKKKYLAVEEVQSDLHQELTRRERSVDDRVKRLAQETQYTPEQIRSGIEANPESDDRVVSLEEAEADTNWNPDFEQHLDRPAVDAPFRPDGMDVTSLMIKRALRLAAEEGYDGVFLVGGKEHAGRYAGNDPELVGRRVRWRWEARYPGFDGDRPDVPRRVYTLDVLDPRGNVLHTIEAAAPELPQYLGEVTAHGIRVSDAPTGEVDVKPVLTKIQKAMVDYYDRQVPKKTEKIVKRWGVQVQPSSVPAHKGLGAAGRHLQDDASGYFVGPTPRIEGHFVPITPEMRDSINTEGFDKGFVQPGALPLALASSIGAITGSAALTDEEGEPSWSGAVLGGAGGLFLGGVAYKALLPRGARERLRKAMHTSPQVTEAIKRTAPAYQQQVRSFVRDLTDAAIDAVVPYADLKRAAQAAGAPTAFDQAIEIFDAHGRALYEIPPTVVQKLRYITDVLRTDDDYNQFFEILRLRRDVEERLQDEGRRAHALTILNEMRAAKAAGDTARAAQLKAVLRQQWKLGRLRALPATLRSGMSKADAIQSLINLETDAQINLPHVADAVARYKATLSAVGQDLLAKGLIDQATLVDNAEYFPDYVLQYLTGQQLSVGTASAIRMKRQGYLKPRQAGRDPKLEVWNDFFGPIGKRMFDQFTAMERIRAANAMLDAYDPYRAGILQLRPGQTQPSRTPAGYSHWTLPGSDADNGTLVEGFLPIPLAAEMTRRFQVPSAAARHWQSFTSSLKGSLIRLSGGGFILNNFLGDAQNMYAATSYGKFLTGWGSLAREQLRGLAASIINEVYKEPAGLSPANTQLFDLAEQGKEAGIGTSAASAEVTGQVLNDPRFRRLARRPGAGAMQRTGEAVADTYIETQNAFDTTRAIAENTNRLAMFLDLVHKGVPAPQAGHIVNKVIGDYSPTNFTPTEQKVRTRLIPFYAFAKNNARNWMPLLAETIASEGKTHHPRSKAAQAILRKWARVAPFSLLALAWNHLMFPDAEAELTDWEKEQFHLLVPDPTDPWDPVNKRWNLDYVGFPMPANIAARAVGMAGLPNRMVHMARGTGSQSWEEEAERAWDQASDYYVSLLHPIFGGAWTMITGRDLQSGAAVAPAGASPAQQAIARIMAPVQGFPGIRPMYRAAREGASPSESGEDFAWRMLVGSAWKNVDRDANAAKAVTRAISKGVRAGTENRVEDRVKVMEQGGLADPTPDEVAALTGLDRAKWLSGASKSLRLPDVVRGAFGASPDDPDAVEQAKQATTMTKRGPVPVPTAQQFKALGPDAALKMFFGSLVEGRQEDMSVWRSWAKDIANTLRREDVQWEIPYAIMMTLQQHPSAGQDIEIRKRIEGLMKAREVGFGDTIGRKLFGQE